MELMDIYLSKIKLLPDEFLINTNERTEND